MHWFVWLTFKWSFYIPTSIISRYVIVFIPIVVRGIVNATISYPVDTIRQWRLHIAHANTSNYGKLNTKLSQQEREEERERGREGDAEKPNEQKTQIIFNDRVRLYK